MFARADFQISSVQQHLSPTRRAHTPVRQKLPPASDTNPQQQSRWHPLQIDRFASIGKAQASSPSNPWAAQPGPEMIEIASTGGDQHSFTEVLRIATLTSICCSTQRSTNSYRHDSPSPAVLTPVDKRTIPGPRRRSGSEAIRDCPMCIDANV